MQHVQAQPSLYLGFYNVENLFDTVDNPQRNDNEFLPTGVKKWDTQKYRSKLQHLADIIGSMNAGKGPDILGLCEVENSSVLAELSRQPVLSPLSYGILHFESPDERGIDNALLYRKSRVQVVKAIPYRMVYPNGHSGTRDVLVTHLKTDNHREMIVMVVHAPSRIGGLKSESKRLFVASRIRHITDSIMHRNATIPIVVMGDFNDGPCDKSIDSALDARCDGKGIFYNVTATYGGGTLYYRNQWLQYDHILVNKQITPMPEKGKLYLHGAGTVRDARLLKKNSKSILIPFRTYDGKKYQNGYSDHLPVYMEIQP